MKPFDLAAALAGEPVVLRNGNKAVVAVRTPNPSSLSVELIGYETDKNGINHICGWCIDGKYSTGCSDSPRDIVGLYKPTPTKEIIRHLLKKQSYVPCYVSDISEHAAVNTCPPTAVLIAAASDKYYTSRAVPYRYAVPFDLATGEAITEIEE